MKKVYCSECEYYSHYNGNCSYPDNKIDTPIRQAYSKRSPEEINKNNDCSWFIKDKSFFYGLTAFILIMAVVIFFVLGQK